ncbi:MAG: hypothetical protein R3C49_03460 [Planctomycetaceae bacterium]
MSKPEFAVVLMTAALWLSPIRGDEPAAADQPANAEETAKTESPSEEWRPKLLVTVSLTEDGLPTEVERVVIVNQYRKVPGRTFDEGRSPRIGSPPPETKTVVETSTKTVKVREPGIARLWCDAISADVSHSEADSPAYQFKTTGRTVLQLSGVTIECDSLELKDGSMELLKTQIISASHQMSSEKLTLPLKVYGLLTETFDQPLNVQQLALTHPLQAGDFPSMKSSPPESRAWNPTPQPEVDPGFTRGDDFGRPLANFPDEPRVPAFEERLNSPNARVKN